MHPAALQPGASAALQYSAASFVETINSASLSMDPDEFVARMISAGVADIEVASQAASPRAQVGAETLRFSAWSEVDRPDSCLEMPLAHLSGVCLTDGRRKGVPAADHAQVGVKPPLTSSWREFHRSSSCKKAFVPC